MILLNIRKAICEMSRKETIAVGVLYSKSPKVLVKIGSLVKLTTKWAYWILKFMECSKSRGTTSNREINPALYEEVRFCLKKDIVNLVLQHNIPDELILKLDQIFLGLVSASIVAPPGSHTVSTIYLGFSFLNGFQMSNFTIHIGYKVTKDKIPWVPRSTKDINTNR